MMENEILIQKRLNLIYRMSLGENCALSAIQSVDSYATTLFTISLNFAKV